MSRPRDLKVLYVFLASPGDLVAEREAARETVDELNDTFQSSLGRRIDLLLWEDAMPGYGRPQAQINPDVDICDVFIGMLWKRWGSSTGEYSSGFEEEFERALARRQQGESPAIWLFFKKVESELLADPGPQLQQVLDFQRRRIASADLLFQSFDGPEQWRSNLRRNLTQFVLMLVEDHDKLQANASASSTVAVAPFESGALVTEELAPVSQHPALVEIMNSLDEARARVEASKAKADDTMASIELNQFDRYTAVRLLLLAKTLATKHSSQLLSSEEINLLYSMRERISPTLNELQLIDETILNDSFDVAPGWYWHGVWLSSVRLLFWFAAFSKHGAAREGALGLLALARVPPSDATLGDTDLLPLVLAGRDRSERIAVLKYLGEAGSADQLPVVEAALEDSEASVRREAGRTQLLILLREAPDRILQIHKRELDIESEAVAKDIAPLIGGIKSETLIAFAQEGSLPSLIRLQSVTELLKRKGLPEDVERRLMQDPSVEIKALVYDDFVGRGEAVDPTAIQDALRSSACNFADSIVMKLYGRAPSERLLEELDYYIGPGPLIYGALAIYHYGDIESRIRGDVTNGFAELRNAAVEKMRRSFGSRAKEIIGKFAELEDYLQDRFTLAALRGIALHPIADDASIARRYIAAKDYDMKLVSARILQQVGGQQDIQTLVKLAQTRWTREFRDEVARAASQLSAQHEPDMHTMLTTEDAIVVGHALATLFNDSQSTVSDDLVEGLLNKDVEDLRIVALAYVVSTRSEDQLVELLNRYQAQSSYYFNVVCWLDRVLYAPPPLKEAFRRSLEAMLPV